MGACIVNIFQYIPIYIQKDAHHEKDWIFYVVITEEYNVMVNSEEFIGTAEYQAL